MTNPTPDRTLVFEWEQTRHTVAEDVQGIVIGTFTAALGLYLLKAAGAVTGGTAGLALLLDQATDLPFWLIFLVVNLPFAVLALWKKGLRFTVLTSICIAGVAGLSVLDAQLLPVTGLNPVYGVFAGNLLAGVGLLILFRHGASVGGVNIIALLLQERTGFRAGWTQMTLDVLVVAASFLVLPWPTVLLSAAGAVVMSLVLAMNHREGRYIGR
ncbi:YitT family protein [Microbacterium marinilacus]|uniref:YitT family protein n=1 Tax=Microbacterium marinilacus TaxID=415209 RepID=A0ABP7BE36_9MICO|nr:YitT family protein [Microbacterium marinilacus]MBY0690234.1 YitT family protein [Microbacterium marinilacus]